MQFESISKVIASPTISMTKMLSKTSLDHFYQVLQTIPKDNVEHGNIQVVTTSDFQEDFHFPQIIPQYQYIESKVQNRLDSYKGYSIQYNMYLPKNDVVVHMHLPCSKSQLKPAMAKFAREIHFIFLWMMLVQDHIRNSCSRTMNIYIIFSPFKKTVGKSNAVMDAYHVNSAFTTSCKEHTDIVIYRNEEWFKVLIHETFHCLGLDFSSFPCNTEKAMEQLVSVHSQEQIRIYESYCEYWAEVMHIVILSYMDTKSKKEYFQRFDFMMRRQLQFSVLQMVKILKHHGLRYHELITHKKKFHEKTHIVSYYIFKTVLLFSSSSFENWCKRHNVTLFQFQQDEGKIKKFLQFIVKHFKNDDFLQYVRKMELYVFKNEKNFPSELLKTMRMTLL